LHTLLLRKRENVRDAEEIKGLGPRLDREASPAAAHLPPQHGCPLAGWTLVAGAARLNLESGTPLGRHKLSPADLMKRARRRSTTSL